ncbi:MAG: hypothetical protein HOM25_12620 [Rhodospirillaceae bacterium]|jgi:hypothetical protein|nr:hypothetical protein [Rhodospirillaceae bacterium]MBT5665247.1 hypothetical protein [Rhodospirillaceae bacterium]MBT5809462.1 hypothetical protein [Rhodospirillaceae bacterium]
MQKVYTGLVAFAIAIPLSTVPVWAHAFGVRYDLPLPLWLYLAGAGAAVALSFAVMAVFLKDDGDEHEVANFDLLTIPLLRWLGHPWLLNPIRLLSLAVFTVLLAAGFFGNPDPFKNIAPTFIWVVWWVGMAFVSALIGNLWDLVNPWKIIFTWMVKLRGEPGGGWPYPVWLGRWPAVGIFLIFAWMELISEQGEQPRQLAMLIVGYSAVTWTGMRMFGRDAWLWHGEIFTVVFELLARFAPSHGKAGTWRIRFPSIGLLRRHPVPVSGVCFVLLLLTSVTFDGILETPMWASILDWIAESQAVRPALIAMQDFGVDLIVVIKSIALFTLPMVFIAVFVLTSNAIAWAGGGGVGTRAAAGYFVLSLIPIAIAYHLSHYLSYLLIAGQNIIPLVSDPFGFGWDLFGTKGYAVDIGVVNAKMIWYVAVTAIVIGHVLAVYVAHVMAVRVFEDRSRALRSQIPMLILMVAYTMISLWILSQPIVA